jgi:hypothetical protein
MDQAKLFEGEVVKLQLLHMGLPGCNLQEVLW